MERRSDKIGRKFLFLIWSNLQPWENTRKIQKIQTHTQKKAKKSALQGRGGSMEASKLGLKWSFFFLLVSAWYWISTEYDSMYTMYFVQYSILGIELVINPGRKLTSSANWCNPRKSINSWDGNCFVMFSSYSFYLTTENISRLNGGDETVSLHLSGSWTHDFFRVQKDVLSRSSSVKAAVQLCPVQSSSVL